jgi:hypothetical protein
MQREFAAIALRAAGVSFDPSSLASIRVAATAALKWADANEESWQRPNCLHWGNILLGEVALAAGDVAEAGRRLLLAGDCGGSPQLASFGPDFELAQKLLDSSMREVVVSYLGKCAKFWRLGRPSVEKWVLRVQAGERIDLTRARMLDMAPDDDENELE